METRHIVEIDEVISKDGTKIGYRRLGKGPGLVIVHGVLQSSQCHMELAQSPLSAHFTIYLPDRRSRGLSGNLLDTYCVQTEVDDLAEILDETDASFVLGINSGALICLEATLSLPAIQKTALFEPPLSINSSIPTDFLDRFDREIAAGKIASALVTGMLGAKIGPPFLQKLPRWFLRGYVKYRLKREERRSQDGDVTMRMLAPTLHHDLAMIKEMSNTHLKYKDLRQEVLLMGATKSPTYLQIPLVELESILPNATRIQFEGLCHTATGNTNRGGHPERVAEELLRFFIR